MSPMEVIPLLVVVLLLVSVGGGDVEQMAVTFQGDHTLETLTEVHVVAGGMTTIPAASSVTGDLYVIGGTTRIEGTFDGDVTVLAGNLSVADGATLTGTVQTISGTTTIADEATVGDVSAFEPPAPASSPGRRIGTFVMQFLSLGFAGWWLVRRQPVLLENVGHSITVHTLVSGVVGTLGAVTLLVLFVYMAFTIVLIPVSVLGLVAEFVIVLYGQVVFGYLIGRRLPISHPESATVVGIGTFLLGLELFGIVPYIGTFLQFGLLAVGFGAVLNTYFGLQRFDPVSLPSE